MKRAPDPGDRVYFLGHPRRAGAAHATVLSVTPLHWVALDGGPDHEPVLAPEREFIALIRFDQKPHPWRGPDDLTLCVKVCELAFHCDRNCKVHGHRFAAQRIARASA